MKYIDGGVCAAKGFAAGGIHCGIRKNKTKKDVALIISDKKCTAASVYTTNLVKGAPIAVTKRIFPTVMLRLLSAIAETLIPATPTELR